MDLAQVLAGCLHPDNQVRLASEGLIKEAFKSPDALLPVLKQVHENANAQFRQLAAILCRKHVPALWSKAQEELHTSIKSTVLYCLHEETDAGARRAVVDLVAVVAKHALPRGGWPQLLPFLQECHQSTVVGHREAAMALFAALIDSVPDTLRPHFTSLQEVFGRGLQDSEHGVKIAALGAVSKLFALSEADGSSAPALQRMVPLVLATLNSCAQQGDDDGLRVGVELLLDLIEAPLPVLTQSLPQVVQFSMAAAMNSSLDVGMRAYCLQVIVWLAHYKPKQLAKHGAVPVVVEALCSLTAEAVPDSFDEELDDEPPSRFALHALDDIARCVPSKHVLPTALRFAEASIQSGEGRYRTAACNVVAVCAEGCCEAMRSKLRAVLAVLAKGLHDTDEAVRGAALFGIAQAAEHLQPGVSEHAQELLPLVFGHLVTDARPGVTERAIHAVDALLNGLDDDAAAPYVGPVVQRLVALLQHAPAGMHDSALTCLATAAGASSSAFAPHAETVLPLLRRYFAVTSDELLTARARATECVGLVAETLGPDVAAVLLPEFLDAAVKGFQLEFSEIREYGHGLFACAARVLKDRFGPYLATVVPLAFESLAQNDGVMMSKLGEDSDDDDDAADDDDGVGREEDFQVRTGVLDEKASALQALGLYAEHAPAAFMPFLETTLEVVKDKARYFHADVRRQAMEAVPRLVCATQAATAPAAHPQLSEATQRALELLLPLVLNRVRVEPDHSVVASCMVSLGNILEGLPPGTLSAAVPEIVEAVGDVLKGTATCQASEDEEEEDEMDEMVEAEEELVACAADVLPKLAHSVGAEACMDIFRKQLGEPFFIRLKPSQSATMRFNMTGTLAEFVQKVKGCACPYVEAILPVLMRELKCEESDNRHHAVYALGLLVESCPQAMGADTLAAIHPLLRDSSPSVIDNACGALARIALVHAATLPLEQLLPVLLDALPLRTDWEEAAVVYGALRQLMTGPRGGELAALRPRVVAACGQVAVQSGAPLEVRQLAAALLSLLHDMDPAVVASCVALLPAEQRLALQGAQPQQLA